MATLWKKRVAEHRKTTHDSHEYAVPIDRVETTSALHFLHYMMSF